MRQIIAIRTNKWSDEEERLYGALRHVEGIDLAVVFHDRPEVVTPPLDVIDISTAWVTGQGLKAVPDWGWRCGDYFYYALRAARPDYSHYWLLEPDLYLSGPAADFFAATARHRQDIVGVKLAPFGQDRHRFAQGMPEIPLWQSIFALTRMSGEALDLLFDARKDYAKQVVADQHYANDEVFCFSTAKAAGSLSFADFSMLAPEWSTATTVLTNPDVLIDTLQSRDEKAIYHPVRGRASFKAALAERMATRAGMLRKFHSSIVALDDSDIADIAELVAAKTRAELARLRRKRR